MALIYNQAWNIKNYRYIGDVSIIVQSDGEESLGTSEVGTVTGSEKQQFAAKEIETLSEPDSEADYDTDSESILPCLKIGMDTELRKSMCSCQHEHAELEYTCMEKQTSSTPPFLPRKLQQKTQKPAPQSWLRLEQLWKSSWQISQKLIEG